MWSSGQSHIICLLHHLHTGSVLRFLSLSPRSSHLQTSEDLLINLESEWVTAGLVRSCYGGQMTLDDPTNPYLTFYWRPFVKF